MKLFFTLFLVVQPIALLAYVSINGTVPSTVRILAAIYVFVALLGIAVNATIANETGDKS